MSIIEFGAPKRSRTPSLLIRSQTLYPIELWAHMEAAPRFELGNKGFADLCLTTWLCRLKNGDPSATRTRDTLIKSQVLYRLS